MKNIFKLFAAVVFAAALLPSCSKNESTFPDWAWTGFVRPEGLNPLITPDTTSVFWSEMLQDSVKWAEGATFNPAATYSAGDVIVMYRSEDDRNQGIGSRTSRLGFAKSQDGLHFQKMKVPVFYPDDGDDQKQYEWPGGCEDPRIAVTEDGLYVMLYTQWNRECPRLAAATSRDLLHWEKYGPVFAKAYDGRFLDIPTKSASIITEMKGDFQFIAKMNGKYWMYWGEQFVNLASSDDLVNWTPMVDENGDLLKVMAPRDGYFDSQLTECGPPAIITKDGILLFYNGKNMAGEKGTKDFAPNTYCAGQALFDKNDPTKLIGRLDKPYLYPTEEFERTGQYVDGTVFTEGMVWHDGRWFLYYGCADSRVAVAVYDPSAKK